MQRPLNLRRIVAIVVLIIVVVTGTTACRERSAAEPASSWPDGVGYPADHNAALNIRLLRNPGFVIGFDRRHGRAAWVAYRVTPVRNYTRMPRPDFQPDPRVARTPSRRVYWGPDYDRGHLAPNYAMSQLYGEKAQQASFYFSNIVPQTQRLNQLLWQRLEEIEIDRLAPRLDTLWVLAGPIFAAPAKRVPVAFFRIWLARNADGQWQVMAFRVPQQVRGDERLDTFLVSIDALEQATGLDFLAGLADMRERTIEAQPADAARWGFAALACMPARYREDWQGRGGIRLHFDRCG